MPSNIQQLLDSICPDPGGLLVRTKNGWAVLLRSAPGLTLRMDPTTEMPEWLPANPPPEGSNSVAQPTGQTPQKDFTAGATVAQVFRSNTTIRVKALAFFALPSAAGWTYRALIANISATGVLQSVLALSPDIWTTAGSVIEAFDFSFPSWPTLPASSYYGFCLVRTDSGTATGTANMLVGTSGAWSIPRLPQDQSAFFRDFATWSRKFYYNSNVTNPVNVSFASASSAPMLVRVKWTT